MTAPETLKDLRALSMTDAPYSAYCRRCWEPVYICWIDPDHGGKCAFPEQLKTNGVCQEAMNRARQRVEFRRFLAKAT